MPSSYSSNLKIELQATGENSGTWGTVTNTNLGTALEQAIVGYGNPSYASDANLTLTYTDTNAAQAARALVLNVTSALSLTATRELVVPTIQKQYIVQNNTTGSQSITVKTSGGTGITVPNGRKAHLYVDGTNVIYMDDYVDINGGSIDGTTIGGSSAAAGTFTTLTTSSTVTLNGGTANGVLYLNGSKVATSGSALTFDGTNLGVGTSSPSNPLTVTSDTSAQVRVGTVSANINARITLAASGTGLNVLGGSGSAPLAFYSSSTELMRLDTSGNLGIGTTSPSTIGVSGYTRLVLGAGSSSTDGLTIVPSGTGGIQFTDAAATKKGYMQWDASTGALAFGTAGTTKATLDSSGNLGIGTSSPSYKLDVSGDGRIAGNAYFGVHDGSKKYYFERFSAGLNAYIVSGAADNNASQGFVFQCRNSNGVEYNAFVIDGYSSTSTASAMTLDASGNLGVGTTSPGYRLDVERSGDGITAGIAGGTYGIRFDNGGTFSSGASTIHGVDSTLTGSYQQLNINGSLLTFQTSATERARITSTGLGITEGNNPTQALSLYRAGSTNAIMSAGNSNTGLDGTWFGVDTAGNGLVNVRGAFPLLFSTSANERARITSGGDFIVGKTAAAIGTAGGYITALGEAVFTVAANPVLYINRLTDDGDLVRFYQADTQEGSISVSGNTVSYNAFAGSHWSQLQDGSKPDILRGTVMESINELCVWPGENNERLPKSKVSDTAGSKKVYGVFMAWDNDWAETNDMLITSVGAFICRVNSAVTVQEGDLLESNGDGTARVQADDIIRSSTIGKVTSTVKTHEYDDGSYCVPTVLYCG